MTDTDNAKALAMTLRHKLRVVPPNGYAKVVLNGDELATLIAALELVERVRDRDAMVDRACLVVAEGYGEIWEALGDYSRNVIRETQRKALDAALPIDTTSAGAAIGRSG